MITWVAHYTDGSAMEQSAGHTYRDIDRTRLQAFDLWRDGLLALRIDFRDDGLPPKRLIWRIRHQRNSAGLEVDIHLAGWQRTVNGCNVQSVAYVFDDGPIMLGGQFVERDFMYKPELLEFEQDLITA